MENNKETPEELLSPNDWYDKKYPNDAERVFFPIHVKKYSEYYHQFKISQSIPSEEEIKNMYPETDEQDYVCYSKRAAVKEFIELLTKGEK